jgi:aspartate ammonia-lyase
MIVATRRERDLLGERDVPAAAYYGIHTLRAVENFPITGIPLSFYPELVRGLARVKHAAALANHDLGLLDDDHAHAIAEACEEIDAGELLAEFVVDVLQGGAGTSSNMNANEVIANRALELLGFPRGDYAVLHPNEHVNLGQSTNDVYPTALKLASWEGLHHLLDAMEELRLAFAAKAGELAGIVKVGRTQLQDAVPMTLGQEMSTYAEMLAENQQRLRETALLICEINLGATAVGTGVTAHPAYAAAARGHLAELTGMPLVTAPNLVEATQDAGVFVELSGVLKRVAVKLSKVCNDLRLLSSGPRAGFGEINLPPVQAGSSIMPGKVNPVIPEVVNQVAFEVIGNDVTVSFAAEGGQLQLNAFGPVIAHAVLTSLRLLHNGCHVLAERCVRGITANRERIAAMFDGSLAMVTALVPFIGYAQATEVARAALASGRSVRELALEAKLLTAEQLDAILQPDHLTEPHLQPRAPRRSPHRPRH